MVVRIGRGGYKGSPFGDVDFVRVYVDIRKGSIYLVVKLWNMMCMVII